MRRIWLAAVLAMVSPLAATAQIPNMKMPGMAMPATPLKGILDRASDSALDKLAKPGAFAADSAIRISLPGPANALGGMMNMAGGGGVTDGLNAAAGQAASAAKPIFRAAIDQMSMKDAAGVVTGGNTAASQYLRRSSGEEIARQLRPLVRSALAKVGVLDQMSKLSALGMNEDTVTNYVVQKTADGIFTYMGREETRIRQNPMGLTKAF